MKPYLEIWQTVKMTKHSINNEWTKPSTGFFFTHTILQEKRDVHPVMQPWCPPSRTFQHIYQPNLSRTSNTHHLIVSFHHLNKELKNPQSIPVEGKPQWFKSSHYSDGQVSTWSLETTYIWKILITSFAPSSDSALNSGTFFTRYDLFIIVHINPTCLSMSL